MGGHSAPTGDGPIESQTWGAKPMAIEGRMAHERERLAGMTDAERAWRKQWLRDQVLSPREPLYIPKTHPSLLNPIRKMYRAPLDKLFFGLLQPKIGEYPAKVARFYTGRILMGVWGLYLGFYYFKYHGNDWTKLSGWRVIKSRIAQYPGDPGYPEAYIKTSKRDYNDRGFKDSVFGKKYDNDIKLDDKW
jgi:NADH dehydrogenase (ubiquinone) 1 beta subcomplex subunit 6